MTFFPRMTRNKVRILTNVLNLFIFMFFCGGNVFPKKIKNKNMTLSPVLWLNIIISGNYCILPLGEVLFSNFSNKKQQTFLVESSFFMQQNILYYQTTICNLQKKTLFKQC